MIHPLSRVQKNDAPGLGEHGTTARVESERPASCVVFTWARMRRWDGQGLRAALATVAVLRRRVRRARLLAIGTVASHLDVATLAPRAAPAVAHEPVVLAVRVAIADELNGMVDGRAAKRALVPAIRGEGGVYVTQRKGRGAEGRGTAQLVRSSKARCAVRGADAVWPKGVSRTRRT
eukprot:7388034-Prymnesium_polylepis.2